MFQKKKIFLLSYYFRPTYCIPKFDRSTIENSCIVFPLIFSIYRVRRSRPSRVSLGSPIVCARARPIITYAIAVILFIFSVFPFFCRDAILSSPACRKSRRTWRRKPAFLRDKTRIFSVLAAISGTTIYAALIVVDPNRIITFFRKIPEKIVFKIQSRWTRRTDHAGIAQRLGRLRFHLWAFHASF